MRKPVYTLFGVTVRSEFLLPLAPAPREATAQVDVVLGRVTPGPRQIWHSQDPEFTCTGDADGIVLDWPDMRFRVTHDRVVLDTDDVEASIVALLQATWSVLLTVRGREALHASVMARDGRAVAVVGASGSGKSTAALALLDRGWQLVADDLLTVDDHCRALPGPPFIRLMPDRAGGRAGQWDPTGKLRHVPPRCAEPVPLGAIVVHGDAYDACRRLTGIAAMDALLSNSYNDLLMWPGQAMRRLDLVAALASRVPVYGVPPRSLNADRLVAITDGMMVR